MKIERESRRAPNRGGYSSGRPGIPEGSPIREKAEDAAFSPSRKGSSRSQGSERPSSEGATRPSQDYQSGRSASSNPRRRDNSSRFDD